MDEPTWRGLPWWVRRVYLDGMREEGLFTDDDSAPAHGNDSATFTDLASASDAELFGALGHSVESYG